MSSNPILTWCASQQDAILQTIREMVECESPSDNPAAINRQVQQICDRWAGGKKGWNVTTTRKPAAGHGDHLLLEFTAPAREKKGKKKGRILGLGHTDTVHPMGTLAQFGWRQEGDWAYGPGSLDMKVGVAFFLHAVDGLMEMEIEPNSRIALLLGSDEEIGSPTSRPFIEAQAKQSSAVLVLEPGTGPTGKLKTSRKGVGDYTIHVTGRASHAGVDFSAGANAILELGRQLEKVATFTNLKTGLTVNPGVITGGTRSNVVPEHAECEVDIRIPRLRDAAPLEKKFLTLKPFDKRCKLTVTGGLNRPPMERTAAIGELFAKAKVAAAELGVSLEESATGGGSDGNFTAALGVPTLDGLGAVGDGAHTLQERFLVSRVADRTALLLQLLATL